MVFYTLNNVEAKLKI